MSLSSQPAPPDQQVVIVSFFGKSSYLSKGCKASALDDALGRRAFNVSVLECPQTDSENHVRTVIAQ